MLFLLGALPSSAAATADCTGRWSDIAWPGGVDPSETLPDACVHLLPEACVLYDAVGVRSFDTLLVEGQLEVEDGADRAIVAERLIVAGSGGLEVGLETDPFLSRADLSFTAEPADCDTAWIVDRDLVARTVAVDDALAARLHAGPPRTLRVRDDAHVDLHGAPRDATWRHVLAHPLVGGASLVVTVGGPVGWAEGDRLVVTSSDYDPDDAEEVVVSGAAPRPAPSPLVDVWLTSRVVHDHFTGQVGSSAANGVPDVWIRPQVGLLTHNVHLAAIDVPAPAGDPCARLAFAGAVLDARPCDDEDCVVDGVPDVRLESVELTSVGEAGVLGRYPVHLHELGDGSDSYVRGVAVHRSANRGIVLHGTGFVEVEDNVVHDVNGHAFYLEPSTVGHGTAHNVLAGNLASAVRGCELLPEEIDEDGRALSSGFWFHDPANQLVDNVAAGAAFAGFAYAQDEDDPVTGHLCGEERWDYGSPDAPEHGHPPSVASPYLPFDRDVAYAPFEDEDGHAVCAGAFLGNWSHSARYGFWADEHKATLLRLEGFRAFKHGERALAVKNHGITEVFGLRAADNRTAVWPASHAYHVGSEPWFWLTRSHVVGWSGEGAAPAGAAPLPGRAGERLGDVLPGSRLEVASTGDDHVTVTVLGRSTGGVVQQETLALDGTARVSGTATWAEVHGMVLGGVATGTVTLSDDRGALWSAAAGQRSAGVAVLGGGAPALGETVWLAADGISSAPVILSGADLDDVPVLEVVRLDDATPVESQTRWRRVDAVALGYVASDRAVSLLGTAPVLGVEVYEGQLRVADSAFEGFPIGAEPGFAAFGTHRDFPFYSNDPDNAVEALEIDLLQDRAVAFDTPSAGASGEAMLLLRDLDGSLQSSFPSAWIAAPHELTTPGAVGSPSAPHVWDEGANATVVDATAAAYGQLLVEWCAAETTEGAERCRDHGGPSRGWEELAVGVGAYDVVRGMEVHDLTEDDTLEARHSVDGTHSRLAANVLSGHTYEVSFQRDAGGLLAPDELGGLRAVLVHLRSVPDGAWVRASIPLPGRPSVVRRFVGVDQREDVTLVEADEPHAIDEYAWDGQRLTLHLEAVGGVDSAVLLSGF